MPIEGLYGEINVDDKQGVTYVIERKDGEDDVIDHADGCQTAQVENAIANGQMVSDVVNGSNSNYRHEPNEHEEGAKQWRYAERIERRMEIEMSPQLWSEQLYRCIECGSKCHDDHEHSWIERRDVVEMYYLCSLTAYDAKGVDDDDDGKKDDHPQ